MQETSKDEAGVEEAAAGRPGESSTTPAGGRQRMKGGRTRARERDSEVFEEQRDKEGLKHIAACRGAGGSSCSHR